MFWKKKEKTIKAETGIPAEINVIPDAFYGGRDPMIQYKSSAEKTQGLKLRVVEKSSTPSIFSRFFANKKLFYSVCAVFLLAIISLISWYYVNQARKSLQGEAKITIPPEQPAVPETPVPKEAVTPATTSTEPVSEEATTTIPILPEKPVLEFAPVSLADTVDIDSDSLTDMEEELFSTDSGKWDTDGDGYYDGQEVFNLYNPKGFAPMKIIDSGLVQEYVNPTWQYRIYYPSVWQVGNVDPSSNQTLFSAVTGDYISVSVLTKQENQTFEDWFIQEAKGQQYTELASFINRFQVSGMQRKDGLVAYFVSGNNIYVISYHSGTSGMAPFRHVVQMMSQSFRSGKTTVEIPEQQVLPEEGITIE